MTILGGGRRMSGSDRAGLALVLLGWAIFCSLEVAFLLLEDLPPAWDQSWHLTLSLSYMKLLWPPSVRGWLSTLVVSQFYPPVTHLSAVPFLAILGPTHDAACAVNLIFALLLCLSTYGLARLFLPPGMAALSGWLSLFIPIFAPMGHEFLTDFPLASVTTLAVLCLLKSESFKKGGWSVAFGLAFGLGMLTKWSHLYLIGPLLAWEAIRGALRGRSRLRNIAGAAAWGMALALPWYGLNLKGIVVNLLESNKTAFIDGDPMRFTLGWFTYYFRRLLDGQLLLPLALLSLAGFAVAIVKRERRMLPFGLWLLGGMATMTTVLNKDPRFTLPLLPAAAVAVAYLVSNIKGGRVRALLSVAVGGMALFQWVVALFCPPWVPDNVGPRWAPLLSKRVPLSRPPTREDWKVDQILDEVERLSGGRLDFCLGVLANHPRFEPLLFRYRMMARHLEALVPWMPCVVILGKSPDRVYWELFGCDFVVTKTGDQGPPEHAVWIYETLRLMRERPEFKREFELSAEFPLPDGSRALVYRRKGKGVRGDEARGDSPDLQRAGEHREAHS